MNAAPTVEESSERRFVRLLHEVERYRVDVETFRADGLPAVWRDCRPPRQGWPLVSRPELAAGQVSVDSR